MARDWRKVTSEVDITRNSKVPVVLRMYATPYINQFSSPKTKMISLSLHQITHRQYYFSLWTPFWCPSQRVLHTYDIRLLNFLVCVALCVHLFKYILVSINTINHINRKEIVLFSRYQRSSFSPFFLLKVKSQYIDTKVWYEYYYRPGSILCNSSWLLQLFPLSSLMLCPLRLQFHVERR